MRTQQEGSKCWLEAATWQQALREAPSFVSMNRYRLWLIHCWCCLKRSWAGCTLELVEEACYHDSDVALWHEIILAAGNWQDGPARAIAHVGPQTIAWLRSCRLWPMSIEAADMEDYQQRRRLRDILSQVGQQQTYLEILHDLLGNPWLPHHVGCGPYGGMLPHDCVNIDPDVFDFSNHKILHMAREIVESRSWDETGPLADLILDCGIAGCETLVEHLQQPRHWRGCWALELLAYDGRRLDGERPRPVLQGPFLEEGRG